MTKDRKRGRVGIVSFLVAGLLAITAGIFMNVGIASAHSAVVEATVGCDNVVHYTVSSWSTGLQGENPDVEIYYTVENSGPNITVVHGAFNAANNYQFSGTFPFPENASFIVIRYATAEWSDSWSGTSPWNLWLYPSCLTSSSTTTTIGDTTTTDAGTTTTEAGTTTTIADTTTTDAGTTTTIGDTTTTDAGTTTTIGDTTTTDAGTTTTIGDTTTTDAGTTTTIGDTTTTDAGTTTTIGDTTTTDAGTTTTIGDTTTTDQASTTTDASSGGPTEPSTTEDQQSGGPTTVPPTTTPLPSTGGNSSRELMIAAGALCLGISTVLTARRRKSA